MNLEPRPVGAPITIQLSGQEFYLLWMGFKELSNQIDDDDLENIIGVDRQTMRSVAKNLGEIWWEIDDAEARSFLPGS